MNNTDFNPNVIIRKSKYFDSTSVIEEQAGFTLLEVLIVVLLVGILAGIAAPSWLAFVNCRRVSAVQDRISQEIRNTQSEAKKNKGSYSISFRTFNQSPQVAIYRVGSSPIWNNLGQDLGISPGQVLIYTNAPNNTVTFDYLGTVQPETTGSSIVAALPGQNQSCKRCISVKTILGVIQTGKGSECIASVSSSSTPPNPVATPPNPVATPPDPVPTPPTPVATPPTPGPTPPGLGLPPLPSTPGPPSPPQVTPPGVF